MLFKLFQRRKIRPVAYLNRVGIGFSRIEPGGFMMGSPPDEPDRVGGESRHYVTLTKPFLMGRTLVSQAHYRRVMKVNPSQFPYDELPVDSVTWDEAVAFCQRLSEMDGRSYRLPTEAEWEYACRAGSDTPFWWGHTIHPGQANYDGRCAYNGGKLGKFRSRTSPVDRFAPNPWGLHDMHGNLWQWCSDWFGKYDTDKNTDPRGALRGTHRVVRGGSWQHTPRRARAAARGQEEPATRSQTIGFRIVCEPTD